MFNSLVLCVLYHIIHILGEHVGLKDSSREEIVLIIVRTSK